MYAVSTNTDIYKYDIATGKTTDLTPDNMGYDMSPVFSADGSMMAYTQMKRDGYESDKNDIMVLKGGKTFNLTADWDGTVNSFVWSNNGESILSLRL